MLLLRYSLKWGLAFMLIMLSVTALFDGLGLTRVRSHYNQYFGSMAWVHYRVTFRPQGLGRQPAPAGNFPILRYGFNLAHHAALRAELLQTDVPLAEVGPLLYDTTRYAHGFSPDSVYAAWVGLRAHYLTFPFGVRPAAVILNYQAVAAPANAPHYPTQPHWRRPLLLYAWASLTLALWFGAAIIALVMLPDYRTFSSRLIPLLLIVLYASARGYVDWLDYTTGQEWPLFGPLAVLLLLAAYAYQLRQPAEVAASVSTAPASK